ncbi:superfamily II helicase [Candidatus Nitrososphaera evergladensis SR1]|jgi:helicase|uniref:ATP-dependent DNA helicase Hel308 n=1 Tax=Candidatus Nitrososphaera evergladensis SR1 TaxID=1459636 RepID=A0A075MUB5_9ARCH|nr:DEAD/DEAH box helicase [Candidatus Nitrososphaera evergladensis]AIF84775.1 superfamily II helicase [Candidatus Nitrososphaera evergladensis SR1]
MQTIPDTIKAILGSLGYESLYPPQEKAMAAGILDGKNVLVTTPTASGKTLVAMMAIARTLQRSKKAVYLTPLRALASEKASDLKALEGIDLGLGRKAKVMVATGDYDSSGKELAFADVIVLTNEKMDTLFRHGVGWLGEVGLFVADEVHLIGDRERGPTLEMMLTRIRKLYSDAQIVALSATVSNADEISDWLSCTLVESCWRPTKLVEGVYEYGSVRMGDGRTFRVQTAGTSASVDLAIDALDNGGQALIFAETRKRASSLAAKAAEGVYKRLDKGARELAAKASAEILDKGDDAELTRTLAQLVGKGVAFHHAGLAPSSRKIVEESFKAGIVKLLTATPTLAAGVNLPARRVVVASILRYDAEYGGNVPISVMEYKQLCGRAGRPKYDTAGEAIIVAESTTATNGDEIYDHYVLGTPEPLRSQLAGDRAIRFHLLSTIASVPGMKKPEILEVFASTLFARQYRSATVQFKVESALEYLESEELVKARNERYIATEFGKRTSLLYIDPQTAVDFRDALNRAEKGRRKRTLGFLHLVTQSPDFYPKLSLRKKDPDEVSLLLQERRGELLYDISEYDCSRSFWALAEWMEEAGDRVLGDRMGVEPGDMHRMVETGEWLAYSLYEVAKLLGREDMLSDLYALRTRIRYGIKDELISLVALEGVGRVRARALYNAGLTDVPKVAKAPQAKLASIPKIGPAVAEKIKAQLARRQTQ